MSIKRGVKNILRKLILLMKEREMVPIPSPVNTNSLLEGKLLSSQAAAAESEWASQKHSSEAAQKS